MPKVPVIFDPDQVTNVEVRTGGLWHRGKLRDLRHSGDGSWMASVLWTPDSDAMYIDDFSARDIRPDQTKRVCCTDR